MFIVVACNFDVVVESKGVVVVVGFLVVAGMLLSRLLAVAEVFEDVGPIACVVAVVAIVAGCCVLCIITC